MKKRIVAIMLGMMVAFSATACGNSQVSNDNVTVKQYKNLEVSKVDKEKVTDENVEAKINENLKNTREEVEVTDRESAMGDTVDFEYTGPAESEDFNGIDPIPTSLELGSGQFIGANGDYKGFEEQLVGHKAGDEFNITVKFPDQYQSEEWAGKEAHFHIKITKVISYKENKLDDAWVQANSETSKNVKEYKEEIKKQLEKSADDAWRTSMQSEVLDALIAQVDVKKLPQDEVDERVKQFKDQYEQTAKSYNMEFADFLQQYMGMTEDEFNKKAEEVSELYVKRNLALQLIAEKNKLEPTEKEYEEKIKEYAISSGFVDEKGEPAIDTFKEAYGEDLIKEAILQEKVVNYLIDKAVQVEADNTKKDTK